MSVYKYSAFDSDGKLVNGSLSANNFHDAREKIYSLGLIIQSISEIDIKTMQVHLSEQDLLSFMMMMLQLLKAGLSLYDALLIIEEQYKDTKYLYIFSLIADGVKSGKDLSSSMALAPKSFSDIYVSIISSGEAAGMLNESIERVIKMLKQTIEFKKKLSSALMYPSLLLSFAFVVVLIMLVFVIPTIAPLLEDKNIGMTTSVILFASRVATFLPIYALLPSIGVFVSILVYFRKNILSILVRLISAAPFVRNIIISTNLANFFNTLGSLMKSGVEMIVSIKIAKEHVLIDEMRKNIDDIIEHVEHGGLLSDLMNEPFFPTSAKRVVKIGESGSDLFDVLINLADSYKSDVDEKVNKLSNILQPLIIVFMGFVVGLIVVGVLFPLTDLSSMGGL